MLMQYKDGPLRLQAQSLENRRWPGCGGSRAYAQFALQARDRPQTGNQKATAYFLLICGQNPGLGPFAGKLRHVSGLLS